MEDTRKGLKNRAPQQESERVITLSPILDTYNGPHYDYTPGFAGEVPADPLNFFPKGTAEVPDATFREWPEKE